MGFSFGEPAELIDDDDSYNDRRGPAERKPVTKLSTLSTLAASLLVYQNVLRGSVGEAFLAALAVVVKFQASNKDVLLAFGKFYAALMAAGYDSWEAYVLDQILLGRDNAFARAVARGEVAADAPVLRAVQYDLQVLQALCVPLARLAESVSEIAPLAGAEWTQAAASISLKAPSGKQVEAGSPVAALSLGMAAPAFVQRPPSPDELEQWRATIASRENWADALPVLRHYYAAHGFGVTSRSSTLRWVKGALEEAPEGSPPGSLAPLSVLAAPAAALAANTARHCDGRGGAQHVLLAGASGSGKTALLWEGALAAGREHGLRLVELPGAELGAVLEAARGCARYPRVRFIIVADNVEFPMRGAAAGELMSGLSGGGPGGWPSNTLLYVGASASSTISFSEPIVQRFGLFLATESDLTPAQFVATVEEVLAHGGGKGGAGLSIGAEDGEGAVKLANATGGLSVRTAVRCAQDWGGGAAV